MSRDDVREHDDLPFLDELGADLSAAFAREERQEAARRRRRSTRLALAAAALLVVVPGAVATRSVWAPTPDAVDPHRGVQTSRAVVVREGDGEQESWRMSAYGSARGACLTLDVFTASRAATGSGCNALVPDRLQVDVNQAGTDDGFVYGRAAPGVARVTVEVSGRPRVTVATFAPPEDAVRRGGLPAGLRFYVATFPDPIPAGGRLTVLALDRSGAVLGRAGSR
jgi:hypothetical protein